MKTPLSIALAALTLSACSSLGGPSPDEIARLPVVRFGQAAPADGKFVLFYPAGVDIPVIARVEGSLLSKTDQARLNVQIKQDLYVYQSLVSFDGKQWSKSHDKVQGKFWMWLPGYKQDKLDAQSPGNLGAEFNLR